MAVSEEKVKVLMEWESPERPYTKRGKTYFKNLFALLVILAAVAVFFKEFILAGALGAVGFLKWALGTNPPRTGRHMITNVGINSHGHEYSWDQLKDFWFGKADGLDVLHIDTKSMYPGRLYMLLGGADKREISDLLSGHLPFRRKVREDFIEKISAKVSRRFPLE